ncbi:MAG: hypothetical protein JOS17DRAFT_763708 [Linnemannia elongata]|nr:MAG: hypothetical protein JOS17DRAFT_763708 [Linnemannia elongata]
MNTQTSQFPHAAPAAINPHEQQPPPPHSQSTSPPSQQQQQQQEQEHQRQPWSFISALSISLYQSLSFSRSPSFERTRYIASTCTFIAIIYLRTLHCLFFGTGALSCAVLAKCLKHIIRQPRPKQTGRGLQDEDGEEDKDILEPTPCPQAELSSPSPQPESTFAPSSSTVAVTTTTATTTTITHINMPSLNASGSTSTTTQDTMNDPIQRAGSPTLSLAPTTTLQKEQMDASNEPKARIASQRIRRYRRRKVYFRVDYGMPSSHAQLVAFFVCYISLQLVLMEPEGSAGQWFLIMLLQLYAWSVVWSRIRLGSHSVSQVLVGAGIGAIYGTVWFSIWVWKVEEMIKHWQWMDRYGVIQVRKIWKQLEMDEAVAVGRADGRMYLRHGQGLPHNGQFLRF